MNHYSISQRYTGNVVNGPYIPGCKITICNSDPNPIIKKIECYVFNSHISLPAWLEVRLTIENETPEMKEKFEGVPYAERNLVMGDEAMRTRKQEDFLVFFEKIQEVDPLPLYAFDEMRDLMKGFINLDVSRFSQNEQGAEQTISI